MYPYSPSGRCREKRCFSVTFSNSLRAALPWNHLPQALSRIPVRKVQGKAVFLRHLLEFVTSRPALEPFPAGPAPDSRSEGAGKSGVSPSPSQTRYELPGPGTISRRSCPGFPFGRCREKRCFSVTFSISLRAALPWNHFPQVLPRIPVRKVPGKAVFLRHLRPKKLELCFQVQVPDICPIVLPTAYSADRI